MNYDVVRARKTNRVGRVGRYDESREGRETGSPPGKYGEETAKSVRNDTRLHRARGKNASLNERSTPDDEERANRDEWISRTGISRSRMSERAPGESVPKIGCDRCTRGFVRPMGSHSESLR